MWFVVNVSEEYVMALMNEDERTTPSLHIENKKKKPIHRFPSLTALNQFRGTKKEHY
jgi:hypothetical protein